MLLAELLCGIGLTTYSAETGLEHWLKESRRRTVLPSVRSGCRAAVVTSRVVPVH